MDEKDSQRQANLNNPVYIDLLAKFDKVTAEIKRIGYDSKAKVEALKKEVNIVAIPTIAQ